MVSHKQRRERLPAAQGAKRAGLQEGEWGSQATLEDRVVAWHVGQAAAISQ